MLMAEETFAVNTSRPGSVPRNSAVRQRAFQSSGGTWRTKKSVGPAASRSRSCVTRSNTGFGVGPNEPVFSMQTVGSRWTRSRAASQ